jgi:dethiobiotin synthetase
MATRRLPGFFVTGTDTGVGKTQVACRIAAALHRQGKRVGIYKPVASGCARRGAELVSADAIALWEAVGEHGNHEAVCPQRFAAPLAPHLAARLDGREVDPRRLRTGLNYWLKRSDIVIVEGAGGLMSPLGDEEYVADLALDLGFPLIVVAPNVLGVINQTLQTLIAAATFRDGLAVAGVVLNDVRRDVVDDPSATSNRAELEKRCVPPVLAHLCWRAKEFDDPVDWYELACRSCGVRPVSCSTNTLPAPASARRSGFRSGG